MIDAEVLNKGVSKWLTKVVHQCVDDMYAKGVRHRDNSTSKQAIFLLVKGALRKKFGVAVLRCAHAAVQTGPWAL